MIPKSGNRFSEKIMLKQKLEPCCDSIKVDRALGSVLKPLVIDDAD
jgi:hypothetical protein